MCNTPGCDNDVQCVNFGLCRNCYGALLRWSKRPQKDVVNRMNKLLLFQARVESVLPTNVVSKRYKRSDLKLDIMPGQYIKRKKLRPKLRRIA